MSEAVTREGCDELQADMAEHQRRFVGEATAAKNQQLAAQAFERLEREKAEQKPAPAADVAAAPLVEKTERKEVDGRSYLMSTSATDDTLTRKGTPAESWFIEHALGRIELLLSKCDTGPLGQASWQQRTLAVMELQSRVPGLRKAGLISAAVECEKRYMAELMVLLEDSNRLFGDWKADKEKKIQVGAGRRR